MDLEIVFLLNLKFHVHLDSLIATEAVFQKIQQIHLHQLYVQLDYTLMDTETVFQITFLQFVIKDSITMEMEAVFLIVFQFLQSAQVDMNLMETELVFQLILY
jgi:hypothetical protein